jgi:branched-chain amino acid transport system substrate-binding protein
MTQMLSRVSRRAFIAGTAATAGVLSAPSILRAQDRTIRIGYITALSGPRAEFGASDPWTLEQMRKLTAEGLTIGGNTYAVEFIVKDNQSNLNRSAVVGNELIMREGVDLLLVQDLDASVATGEISDIAGIPSISTMGPWQAWMFGRGSNPEQGFPYSFTFFWGADQTLDTFGAIWDQVDTNKVAGDFYFDNSAGNSFADTTTGMPAVMEARGYERVFGGMFPLEAQDFSNQVSMFKDAGADIVTGFGFAPHWATFWKQAGQMGYTPEVACFAAAFLFPSAIEALGDRGDGMSTEVWWTPNVPFASSLTGQSASELAQAWEDNSGSQWIQTLGYSHALFEVGIAALIASGDPKNPDAVRDAIAGLSMDTMVGPVDFAGSPVKNVAITEVGGGQWRKTQGGKFDFDLRITDNTHAPSMNVEEQTVALSKLG